MGKDRFGPRGRPTSVGIIDIVDTDNVIILFVLEKMVQFCKLF